MEPEHSAIEGRKIIKSTKTRSLVPARSSSVSTRSMARLPGSGIRTREMRTVTWSEIEGKADPTMAPGGLKRKQVEDDDDGKIGSGKHARYTNEKEKENDDQTMTKRVVSIPLQATLIIATPSPPPSPIRGIQAATAPTPAREILKAGYKSCQELQLDIKGYKDDFLDTIQIPRPRTPPRSQHSQTCTVTPLNGAASSHGACNLSRQQLPSTPDQQTTVTVPNVTLMTTPKTVMDSKALIQTSLQNEGSSSDTLQSKLPCLKEGTPPQVTTPRRALNSISRFGVSPCRIDHITSTIPKVTPPTQMKTTPSVPSTLRTLDLHTISTMPDATSNPSVSPEDQARAASPSEYPTDSAGNINGSKTDSIHMASSLGNSSVPSTIEPPTALPMGPPTRPIARLPMGPPSRLPVKSVHPPTHTIAATVADSQPPSLMSRVTRAGVRPQLGIADRRPTKRTASGPSSAKPLAVLDESSSASGTTGALPVRRKPSYPSSLGSGPLAKPRSRLVSGPIQPPRSFSATATPSSSSSSSSFTTERSSTQEDDDMNGVPNRVTPRSVSDPVTRPRASLSLSTRREGGDTSQSLASISDALAKLKVRKVDTQSSSNNGAGPSVRPKPLASSTLAQQPARASILKDVSQSGLSSNFNTILNSSQPMATSSRLSSVHRPRASYIGADVSMMDIDDSSLATLVSTETDGKPLKGVVAFVDVRTDDGASAGVIWSDMLVSLGARVSTYEQGCRSQFTDV